MGCVMIVLNVRPNVEILYRTIVWTTQIAMAQERGIMTINVMKSVSEEHLMGSEVHKA